MMQMAGDNNVSNDKDFDYMLDKAYLHEQPQWLKELARQQTTVQRHKAFVNLTAKATGEQYTAFNRLLVEGAKGIGKCTVAQLSEYLRKPSTVPDGLKDGFIRAATYIHENMREYDRKADGAMKRYDYAVARLEADFTRRFRSVLSSRVKDVTMYPNRSDGWNIRCCIGGEQMMGRPISNDDANVRKGAGYASVKDVAAKYYRNEIIAAMDGGQKRSAGLSR